LEEACGHKPETSVSPCPEGDVNNQTKIKEEIKECTPAISSRHSPCESLTEAKGEISRALVKWEDENADKGDDEDDEESESDTSIFHDQHEEESELAVWSSSWALVRFRQSAKKIAEAYLKSTGTKLRSVRSRERLIRDWDAYQGGLEDSKKIDVKRRRIEHV
jgi:hypothetical protein